MKLRRILLVAWMALIFFLSQDSDSGTHSGWILDLLRALFPWAVPETAHFVLRKLAHFSEYAVLFFLWRWNNVSAPLSFIFTAFYAGTDEFHQAFVPGRGPSLLDVAIDSSGALFAWGLSRLKHLLVCCTPHLSE